MKKTKKSLFLLILPIIIAVLTLTACDDVDSNNKNIVDVSINAEQVENTNSIKITWDVNADIDEIKIIDIYHNEQQSSTSLKNNQLVKGHSLVESNYGKGHNIKLYAYKNGSEVFTKAVDLNISASEYNIAPLIATVPVTIMALNLNNFSNDYSIPTLVWLERTAAWNLNSYPKNVFPIPTATKEELTHNQSIATIYDKTTAYVKELYEINNNSKFHFYYNDIWCGGALAATVGNGLPTSNYDITLLSDGIGSYSYFNQNFNNANASTNYATMKTQYEALKAQIATTKDYSFAETGYEISPWDFGKYCYVMTKEEPNVTWYLNRLNGTMATLGQGTAPSAADPDNPTEEESTAITNYNAVKPVFDNLNTLKDNGKIVLYNLGNMLASLSTAQKAQIKSLYNFGSAMFDVAKEQNKDIMIILGTSTSGEVNFNDYLNALTTYYGNNYVYYYKGHPGYPTYAISGKAEMLQNAGLLELDSAIAAELIFFFNPEAVGCGYQSSTFDSLNDAQSACLFNVNYDTTTLAYKDNIEVYITKVNDDDAVYDSIVEGDDKYLMQFPKSEEYDIGIFDATNKTITYYTKNTDNTFTAIE